MEKSIILGMIVIIFAMQPVAASRLSDAVARDDSNRIIQLLAAGDDPIPLVTYRRCGDVVHKLCYELRRSFATNNEADLQQSLAALHRLMDDCLKDILITPKDILSEGPDMRSMPLPLVISNYLTMLQYADFLKESTESGKLSVAIKKKLAVFWDKPATLTSGVRMSVREYCHIQAARWEKSQMDHLSDALKDTDDIAAKVDALVATAVPGMVNVTVISLPTLLQSADVARELYKHKYAAADSIAWANACGYYATYHMVNAWRYRGNAAAMFESFGRNNFSTCLALIFSGRELVRKLEQPALFGEPHAEFRDRQKYYPAIIADLKGVSSRHMQSVSGGRLFQLMTSYAFLSGLDESTFHFCPFYQFKGNIVGFGHQIANYADGEMASYLKDLSAPSVFPLMIITPRHASSALVYKFNQPAKGSGTLLPHYIVFFAESNRFAGHLDSAASAIGEEFNFKTAFINFFSKVEACGLERVNVQGPGEFVATYDAWRFVQGINKKFTDAGGKTFDFPPDDAMKARIIAQNNPTTLFSEQIGSCDNIVKIRQALELGADPKVKNEHGYTMFHTAIETGKMDILALLCEKGKEAIDIADTNYDNTPLLLAVYRDRCDAVTLLLNAEADVCIQNKEGLTAFHLAVLHQKWEIFDELCRSKNVRVGMNVYSIKDGCTPLHYLVANVKTALVKRVLELGADANLKNKEGATAFHVAVRWNRIKILKQLCITEQASATINITDNEGKTPLDRAYEQNNTEAVSILEVAGAKRAAQLTPTGSADSISTF
jgi:ankyrin repeat protein/uncharacterized protein YjiS (DUF1127 family)